MTVLIVGGDYIASLRQKITAQGYARIEHWSGRKKGFNKRALPGNTELVIIVYDYVSHSLAHSVKNQASRIGIPMIFCRRSMHEINTIFNEKEAETEDSCCCINLPMMPINLAKQSELSSYRF